MISCLLLSFIHRLVLTQFLATKQASQSVLRDKSNMSSSSQLPLTDHSALSTPLPPAPSKDPLTPDQWRNYWAFADTVVPACHMGPDTTVSSPNLILDAAEYEMAFNQIDNYNLDGKHPGLAKEYLEEKPSDNPLFRENVYRLLSMYLPKDLFQQLTLGLTLLK